MAQRALRQRRACLSRQRRRYVDSGEHEYQIRYRTTRQLGFFADHDELYWNVTGNGWDFAIDHASAAVSLPDAVASEQIKLPAIPEQGSKGVLAWQRDAPSHVTFETTRTLAAKEGLTIVVEFPKGIIVPPTSQQQLAWLLADNTHILIGGSASARSCLSRWLGGRSGATRAAARRCRSTSADGWTPAELRYVEQMAYDDRCFARISSTLRAWCRQISQAEGGLMLRRRAVDRAAVAGCRADAVRRLLGDATELVLAIAARDDRRRTQGPSRAHRTSAQRRLLHTNGGKLGVGVLLALVAIYFVDATAGNLPLHDSNGKTIPSLVLLVFSAFPIVFASLAIGIIKAIVERRRNPATRHFVGDTLKSAGALVLLAIGALIGVPGGWFGFGLAAVLIGVIAVATILLPAPTLSGRKLLDQIAGLRLYLGVAERDSLAQMRTPEMTQKEFERFLPYALALEVEKTWCDRFAAAVGPAAAAAAMTSMAWYQGGSAASFGSFSSGLGDSLSSTISSSASAPGSSSGGGGGGSSGGGGGGGGGGGW